MFKSNRFPLVAMLALAVAFTTGCDDDDDPTDEDGDDTVTFTFDAPAGAPAVTSVNVPGEFNDPQWNPSDAAFAMTEQSDGSWELTVELAPGTYEYKYYINGAWVENMCDDATWGDPVSPQNEGCAGATNNATITVE